MEETHVSSCRLKWILDVSDDRGELEAERATGIADVDTFFIVPVPVVFSKDFEGRSNDDVVILDRFSDALDGQLSDRFFLVVKALFLQEVLLVKDFVFHGKNRPQKKNPFMIG